MLLLVGVVPDSLVTVPDMKGWAVPGKLLLGSELPTAGEALG